MVGKGEAPAPREPEEEEDTGGVVKLISAEGFEFVVDKKAAMVSNTLRNMLTSPGTFRGLLRDAPGRGPLPGDLYPHPREDLPVLLLVAPLLQWEGDGGVSN
ncbi:uncharacterized protein LOC120646970 isoform X2 [Panicum virgatum]|uniref:uncharacterized protein LOC120646970 isoform X2 n=1 Tax=Panicum virgatum TaxID=38727 RepID=UPI0019D69474|nr:uncharacterized protein LOC120646970 isoform X2 [Panicum virgatum]